MCGVELHVIQIPLTSNNNLFQECPYDNHTDAAELRKGRVRSYLVTYTITPDCPCGCPDVTTYILENYLIIDNATESDAGDYTFTANIHGADPTTIQRNFSTIVGIYYSTYVISHHGSSCSYYSICVHIFLPPECRDGRDAEEFRKAITSAACDYSYFDLLNFRRDTRSRHGKAGASKWFLS